MSNTVAGMTARLCLLATLVWATGNCAWADDTAVTTSPALPLVVFIGGMDSDPSREQIDGTARRGGGNSGLFQLKGDLPADGCLAEYFNWNGTRAGEISAKEPPLSTGICSVIRGHCEAPKRPLVIVGNSWGGHTAWEVCQSLSQEPAVPVKLLVLLDPSSAGRAKTTRPVELPRNVDRAVNYYTRNVFGWRNWPDEPRIRNIDLGDPANGFVSPQRQYDAAFNFQAHVQAEWDQRIHAEMLKQILEVSRPGEAVKQGEPQPTAHQSPTTSGQQP